MNMGSGKSNTGLANKGSSQSILWLLEEWRGFQELVNLHPLSSLLFSHNLAKRKYLIHFRTSHFGTWSRLWARCCCSSAILAILLLLLCSSFSSLKCSITGFLDGFLHAIHTCKRWGSGRRFPPPSQPLPRGPPPPHLHLWPNREDLKHKLEWALISREECSQKKFPKREEDSHMGPSKI